MSISHPPLSWVRKLLSLENTLIVTELVNLVYKFVDLKSISANM